MRVAAIDIGTNTVRLLIADVADPGLFAERVTWRDRRSTVVRLGEDVDREGRLAEAAMVRAVRVLADYGDAVRSWQCDAVRAVATSAARDAANREEFLDRAANALGVRPEVIHGEEEAVLSFAGSTAGVGSDGPILVIDPGGGSTEFVMGFDHPTYVVSVEIGSVRLTERELPDRPATAEQLHTARLHTDFLLERVMLSEPPASVVGVGGTFTALGAIAQDLATYDSDAVHGTSLTMERLHEMADWLATLTLGETEAIPSLDPARAPVLLGGAVVAERAAARVGTPTVTVSERDILDGIALSLA